MVTLAGTPGYRLEFRVDAASLASLMIAAKRRNSKLSPPQTGLSASLQHCQCEADAG